jgi:hypothetical protein
MGIPVLILGYSGSGKTRSIKLMDPNTTGVFLVEKPRLPFREPFKVVKNAGYPQIMTALKNPTMKSYVIDDSQYIMANEFFDRAGENGYQKFVDIGANFRNLIHLVNNELPDDVIVYFLHHPEMDSNTGKMKAKTIGKMLDEKLTLEGCFDIVLFAKTDGQEHWFQTQSDGTNTAKSPEEMFPAKIPNDLALVDRTIREYYGIAPLVTKETEEKEGN